MLRVAARDVITNIRILFLNLFGRFCEKPYGFRLSGSDVDISGNHPLLRQEDLPRPLDTAATWDATLTRI